MVYDLPAIDSVTPFCSSHPWPANPICTRLAVSSGH
jgi:hypothetical protein